MPDFINYHVMTGIIMLVIVICMMSMVMMQISLGTKIARIQKELRALYTTTPDFDATARGHEGGSH